MENQSPFLAMQQLEVQLKSLLRTVDTDLLTPDEQKALASLRRLAADARLDIRDYELSETRAEQLGKMQTAQQQLQKLQNAVLAAGNVFGPADVAHLGAQLEQMNGWLR
ncbi:MAG TPA: hypothetical protein VLF69_04895 [Candidatus Saccharimonadales bacterium]|nr:hypothetical protein [Candidatus Saccharimonadales bacterium]